MGGSGFGLEPVGPQSVEHDPHVAAPHRRLSGRRGHTPVRVTAAGAYRVSLAALICAKPGHQPRLIYRTLTDRWPGTPAQGIIAADYARLLDAANSGSADRSCWCGTTSTPTGARSCGG